jgi:hypothetical protein
LSKEAAEKWSSLLFQPQLHFFSTLFSPDLSFTAIKAKIIFLDRTKAPRYSQKTTPKTDIHVIETESNLRAS